MRTRSHSKVGTLLVMEPTRKESTCPMRTSKNSRRRDATVFTPNHRNQLVVPEGSRRFFFGWQKTAKLPSGNFLGSELCEKLARKYNPSVSRSRWNYHEKLHNNVGYLAWFMLKLIWFRRSGTSRAYHGGIWWKERLENKLDAESQKASNQTEKWCWNELKTKTMGATLQTQLWWKKKLGKTSFSKNLIWWKRHCVELISLLIPVLRLIWIRASEFDHGLGAVRDSFLPMAPTRISWSPAPATWWWG